ncbi:MAG: RNA polymerase sigma factor [Actinomycetota bacterium]
MTRSSHPPDDEHELIARASTDPEAFAELYRRHVDGIHRFALRRTGAPDVAEDVTAVTFERALARIGGFRAGPNGIRPWLYRIAANELADRHRRASRRRGDPTQRAADRTTDRVAHGEFDRVDDGFEAAVVRDAMDTLSARYQQALTLRYLADLEPAEAAAVMGVPRPLFSVVLNRATNALRLAVERREPDRGDT